MAAGLAAVAFTAGAGFTDDGVLRRRDQRLYDSPASTSAKVAMSKFHLIACPTCAVRAAKLMLLSAALLIFASASVAFAQEKYATPEAAVDALVASARSGDEKAGLVVLGPRGGDIISSGDKVSDDRVRTLFVSAYEAKHEIKMQGNNKATLIIGDKNYPFPIPLVRKDDKWSFDTEAGRIEILARRIGHNELDTIQTTLAYVDAQGRRPRRIRVQGSHG
jgi:hypothetical protein